MAQKLPEKKIPSMAAKAMMRSAKHSEDSIHLKAHCAFICTLGMLSTALKEEPGDPDSVFNKINELFDYLPLAALIDDKIVCLHGGIGSTLLNLDQVDQIVRPLEVIHEVSTPEQ